MEPDTIDALKKELDYFIRLSQAQAEQIKKYKILQQRSHRLIQILIAKTAKPKAGRNQLNQSHYYLTKNRTRLRKMSRKPCFVRQ